MTPELYIPDPRAQRIGEAHDVLADDLDAGVEWPLTCRWPEDRAPRGVVVFCHGLGSSGREYAGISGYWAAHGYLVIQPTFPDSIAIVARREPELGLDPEADLSGWTSIPEVRARMHEILHAPDRWMGRLDIVRKVMAVLPRIFEVTCGAPSEPISCAIAGHSFGAYTAQLLAGAEIDMPDRPAQRFRDLRFRAAILLSAQGRDQQGLRDGSWRAMEVPMLNVTGTRDRGAKGGNWHWKCEPYEFAPEGGKYLAVIEEGDHFLGGITERDTHAEIPAQIDAVKHVTLAFLDAHLRDREAARIWLGAVDGRIGDCPVLFKRK